MPKVSIIIPVYNVEKYLYECLDSVIAQTLTDWECICVDDGSIDSSPAILDEYAERDCRFRVIHLEHSNAGACRNVGLDLAQGEYLSFLDSDDIFAPKMLEILTDTARRESADIVSCGQITYIDGEVVPRLSRRSFIGWQENFETPREIVNIYKIWCGRAWDKLFSKAFIIHAGIRFQEIRSTNDMRFTFSALALARKVTRIDCALVAHRTIATSLEATRSKGALCMIDALKSYDNNMRKLHIFGNNCQLEYYFKRWIVDIMFWYMDTIDTTEAYKTVHEAFFGVCQYFSLEKLTRNDFQDNFDEYDRFHNIIEGCSPLESSRLHEVLLMKELESSCSLESRDYRLGHAILVLPRLMKMPLLRILNFFRRILYPDLSIRPQS